MALKWSTCQIHSLKLSFPESFKIGHFIELPSAIAVEVGVGVELTDAFLNALSRYCGGMSVFLMYSKSRSVDAETVVGSGRQSNQTAIVHVSLLLSKRQTTARNDVSRSLFIQDKS